MVELDVAGDVDDGGLAWLAGGKVGRLSWICGAVAFGAVTDAGGGGEDSQQERGEREFWLVRGKSRDGVRRGGQGVREADPGRGNAGRGRVDPDDLT
jgi:hypothetical protein